VNVPIRNLLAAVSLLGFLPGRGQAAVGQAGAARSEADSNWRVRRAGLLRHRAADLEALRAQVEGLLREGSRDF